MRIELDMIARFSLRRNGVAVSIPPAAERLVAYVALHDRPVRRGQVASALWTKCPRERRTANLRSALWRLRMIDNNLVETSRGDLSVGSAITVDARESVRLVRSIMEPSAGSAVDDGDGRVLRLLSSDLLPHWYDDWLVLWQERWRQLRLHALEAFAIRLATDRRYGEAVEAALAAVRSEPLRESAHHCLIFVHLQEGNRIEAVRAYHRLVDLLSAELGVRPSEEIRRTISGALGQAS
jgi:DNA-binding SARP family transcriptional activator